MAAKKAKSKNKVIRSPKQIFRREFKYSIGEIQLAFNLRTDIPAELIAFKLLLERALLDMNLEIDFLKESKK